MTPDHKKNWKCQECVTKKPKTDTSNTPSNHLSDEPARSNVTLRRTNISRTIPNSQHTPQTSPVPAYEAKEAPSDLSLEIRLLREEIKTSLQDFKSVVSTELLEFRSVVLRLTEAMTKCDKTVEELTLRVEALERERDQRDNTSNNSELEQTIACLQMEVNDRDQEILHNDVEIAGIPEENNERPLHIALTVSNKLGVTLEERDIVYAERVGPIRRGDTQDPRPRPLVVRLARRSQRVQLLAAARVRRGITTADMGLTSTVKPFYVNERLTRHNRQLFHKARAEAMLKQWKYVWTRDGCIYARKEHGAPRHRLRTDADITKVFG